MGKKSAKQRYRGMMCIYCNEREATSDDHIPAQCMFGDNRPPNSQYVIVPACRTCNCDTLAQDQGYFRDMFVMDQNTFDHPVAQSILEGAFVRSVSTNRSELARDAQLYAEFGPRYTPGGMYLGDAWKIPLDGERIARVVKMTVRGLFYHEKRMPLPSHYSVDVAMVPQWSAGEMVRDISKNLPLATTRDVANRRVFKYTYAAATEDPMLSLWLLEFYEGVLFIAGTISPEARQRRFEKYGVDVDAETPLLVKK